MAERVAAALSQRFALLVVFGAFSFSSVALGAYICAEMGVPSALWVRNLAAWGVGALAALAIALTFRAAMLHVALWAAPLGLLLTFLSPAQEGAHRWVDVGPLYVNAAMLLLPAMIVAVAMLSRRFVWAWAPPLVCLVLLVLQPDASQATALALVVVTLAATSTLPVWARLAIVAAAGVLGVLAWFQPDPLAPVPEVEEILRIGMRVAPIAAGLALACVAATALCFGFTQPHVSEPTRGATVALSVCFLAWIVTTYFGAFPVPWVGIGLSPIVGAWLGVGLLVGLRREAGG